MSNSNKHLKQLLIVDPRVLEQPQLAPVGCASPASAASFSLAVMSSWRSARDRVMELPPRKRQLQKKMSALSKFFLRFCANLFGFRFSLIACNSPPLKQNRPTASKTSIPPPCGEKTAASPRLLALAAAPAWALTDRERERERQRERERKTEKDRERQRKTEKDRDRKLTSQVKQHPTNRIILKGIWFAKSKHLSPRQTLEAEKSTEEKGRQRMLGSVEGDGHRKNEPDRNLVI